MITYSQRANRTADRFISADALDDPKRYEVQTGVVKYGRRRARREYVGGKLVEKQQFDGQCTRCGVKLVLQRETLLGHRRPTCEQKYGGVVCRGIVVATRRDSVPEDNVHRRNNHVR